MVAPSPVIASLSWLVFAGRTAEHQSRRLALRQFKFLLNRPAPGKPIADPCDPKLERGAPDLIGYGGLDDSFQIRYFSDI